jgi:hypothetical protein
MLMDLQTPIELAPLKSLVPAPHDLPRIYITMTKIKCAMHEVQSPIRCMNKSVQLILPHNRYFTP